MFKLYLLVIAALPLVSQTVKGQIVNGVNAAPHEFPYQAILKQDDKYFCVGALISRKHVLTAGHCVEGRKGVRTHRLTTVVGTNSFLSGGQCYPIGRKTFYPDYVRHDRPNWMYDIGIFTLKYKVHLSDFVDIVKLPSSGKIEIGSNAIFSAAGCMSIEGPPSQVLQKLNLRIIDRETCQNMVYAVKSENKIYESHICTYNSDDHRMCSGDSGGPLVQNNIIIGVLSGGLKPCPQGVPDIFTNVFEFMPWITETIGQPSCCRLFQCVCEDQNESVLTVVN